MHICTEICRHPELSHEPNDERRVRESLRNLKPPHKAVQMRCFSESEAMSLKTAINDPRFLVTWLEFRDAR